MVNIRFKVFVVFDFLQRVQNPIAVKLEQMGWIAPKLVAVVDHEVEWPVVDDADDMYEEEITFFLLEYPSGRRTWEMHQYGKNEEQNMYEIYLREVLIWTMGGPLPPTAVKPGAPAKIINLRVIKGQAESDESE